MKTTSKKRSDRVRLQRRRRLASLLAAAPAALVAAFTSADLARIHPDGDAGSTVQAPADNPPRTGNEEIAQSWRNY